MEITPEDQEQFRRLDQLLAHALPLSRTFIKKLFDQGDITLDQGKLELKKMPAVGSKVTVLIPPPAAVDTAPENIPLEILYEDEHLLFVNKPAGLVTHPAPGNYTGTLVNAVLYHCPDLKGVGNEKRPGIVHRLDKGTSGVMVVAKTQAAHEGLILLFSKHNIERVYQALVMGTPKSAKGKLESTLGRHPQDRLKMAVEVKNGKKAVTYYRVLEYFKKLSLVECTLETGRTHQIRVHLTSLLKTPILGDPLYAHPPEQLKRLGAAFQKHWGDYAHPLLHARTLGLVHPITGKKLSFTVEAPAQFQDMLKLAREEEQR